MNWQLDYSGFRIFLSGNTSMKDIDETLMAIAVHSRHQLPNRLKGTLIEYLTRNRLHVDEKPWTVLEVRSSTGDIIASNESP